MRCGHDYLMEGFSFYMRLPCLLAETLMMKEIHVIPTWDSE